MKIYKIKFSPEIIFYLFIRQKLCFLNEVMGGLFHDPHGGVLNKEKPCQPPASAAISRVGCLAFLFLHQTFKLTFDVRLEIKKPAANATGLFPCSGGRIRTSDLWVMSPTSCHCSTPQY